MRYFPWLLGGFGLMGLSKMIAGLGDALPSAAQGPSWDRATFHSLALLALLGGMACFVRAALAIFRSARGTKPGTPAARLTASGTNPDAPVDAFDADAALARYLERKQEEADSAPPPAPRPRPPVGGGFGRRGL